jgi:hypothetical protein
MGQVTGLVVGLSTDHFDGAGRLWKRKGEREKERGEEKRREGRARGR